MKIGFLLHRGIESAELDRAVELMREARAKGHEVNLFLMSAGVTALARQEIAELALTEGAQVVVCDHNRGQYAAADNVKGARYGSQYDLAGIVHDCDRLVTFA